MSGEKISVFYHMDDDDPSFIKINFTFANQRLATFSMPEFYNTEFNLSECPPSGHKLNPQLRYDLASAAKDNEDLKRLFDDDQAIRQGNRPLSSQDQLEDRNRRDIVRELSAQGAISSGMDHFRAAYIFQHGSEPRDYLLAHAHAIAALGAGVRDAQWIAAATLDRYLLSIGQKQVLNTQYTVTTSGINILRPADDTVIPASLRVLIVGH